MESNDQELVESVQRGNKRAFDILVRKYQGKLAGIVSRYVYDHTEVEDVVQEAFIKAYRALDNFRGESAFYTWLYRIAINTAKNHLVATGRRPPGQDMDAGDAINTEAGHKLRDTNTPENSLMTRQLAEVLQKTLDTLPDDLREAIMLREMDGMSYEEIGEVMACPIGTVRSRIFRAREFIDKELKELLEP